MSWAAPDGAIVSHHINSPKSELRGKRVQCPAVFVGGDTGKKEYGNLPAVLLDRRKSGYLAIDHLADRGFSHVLVFVQNNWRSVAKPFRGAKQRARERGLAFHIHQLLTPPSEKAEDKHARWVREIGEVISAMPRPLACLAVNDFLGAKLCFDCQRFGFSIPEDVAILGFGNYETVCNTAPVPLSSVDWNWKLAFQTAADKLEDILSGGKAESEPVMIPPKAVIVRRSTDILAVSEPRVAKAVRFMWDHLQWPITVEDVAYEVGVNRRTLSRMFSEHLGRGVKEELNRRRLERSTELLRAADLSVGQICKAVGFPSQPYFQRIFLAHYGITPGDFKSRERRS